MTDEPNWEGAGGRGEHRTVGPHRAHCFQCSGWCWSYKEGWCECCDDEHIPHRWRGDNVGTVLDDLRKRVGELPHAPACPGGAGCWCPVSAALRLLEGDEP